MDVRLLWSLAETGYSLAAIAGLAVSWDIWRRAPRDRETAFLCGSVLLLALHYGLYAADAFVHASESMNTSVTVWAAGGQATLVVSGILVVVSLFLMAVRAYSPIRLPRWVIGVLITCIGASGILVIGATARLVWGLMQAPSPDVADRHLRLFILVLTQATALCYVGTLASVATRFDRVPSPGRARWTRLLTEGGPWRSGDQSDTDAATNAVARRATLQFRSVSLLFLCTAYVLSIGLTLAPQGVGPIRSREITPLFLAAETVVRMSLLPALLRLTYYHSRFLFFDVLIKRGVIWSVIALCVTVPAFALATRLNATGPLVGLACVGVTILIVTAATMMDRSQRWLDSILFHRPNYRAELARITAEMAACPTVDSVVSIVTARLQHALSATFVSYATETATDAEVVVGLGHRERCRGYLQLGPRARGQEYRSEDLTFVDAVAAHLTSLLDGFEARESTRLATIAELKALRAQINPHFLFNALSTLAEMAHGQPATERAILNLARVFRYALDATQHELVPLGEEIDALRAYLEIEAERFDDQLRFDIAVPSEVRSTPIPPMLLQPLVENAVKHGLSSRVGGGMVRIVAEREEGLLRLTVQDDGVGFDLERTPRRIGLSNVGARVEQTGGWWRVQSIPGAGTQVTLTLTTT
jgi:signal transduction histidine kinase